ncbi:MAG: efflux RND transporter permease subunit [Candidatus Latescibacterota bacterium]|nr:efflux RND transporter permease subunit [Candidatus Latescibacterota bacterium]
MKDRTKHLLPRLSVRRPVSVVVTLVALLVVGYIVYTRISIGLLPGGLDANWLGVSIGYPNASPLEVEQKIARKVEESISTIPGVKEISTRSNRGGWWASIRFRQGMDMSEAYAVLMDRMDRLKPELPDEVDRIWVRRWDPDDWPIMNMAAYLPEKVVDPQNLLETHLKPELQRIEGVGVVEIWGEMGKGVYVDVNQEKVRSHGIDLWQVGQALGQHNFTLPGGYVHEGGRKIYVRSMGRYASIEEIENLVIDTEHNLRLSDIAEVSLKPPTKEWFARLNRRESVGIEIKRTSDGNIADISSAVRDKLEELENRPHLLGIEFEIFWDQGVHVNESVDNLKATGIWGGLFAAVILYLFLRAVRMTVIITAAIPLSLLISVTAIYFTGWTLNVITMMGLMLSLGLVVDNAIVIVENIYRKRQEGMEPEKASIEGAGEVGLAVIMATLTTVVVFLPLILMNDDAGFSFFMLRLGMPVIVGLIASLFIALAVIPLAALRLPSGKERKEPRIIGWGRRIYERNLHWVLNHRVDAVIIVALMMASIQIPLEAMKKTDRQEGQRNDVWLAFDMPSGQSLEQADKFIGSVEDTLMNHKREYNVKVLETWSRNDWGRVHIIHNEAEQNEWYAAAWENLCLAAGWKDPEHLGYNEVVEDIKERVKLPPGTSMRVNWRSDGGDDAAVSLNLYGDDTSILLGLSAEVERRLRTIPGLLSVQADVDRGQTELRVRLNRDQVRRYGFQPQTISGNINYALRGYDLTKYRTDDGREVGVFMRLEEADRQSMLQLRNLTFQSENGTEVPLESLADIEVTRSLGGIRREDRQTLLKVTATATKEDSKELFAHIDEAMIGFEMPRGYRWDKGARYERLEEQDQSQIFALVLSVTFVFLLMGVLFESFILPLSVIIAIPFAFLGVYWTLYLTDTTFDMLCAIGTVILVGVVVNNAIVLIDMANRMRTEGMTRFEALMAAGRHRFRPILMTTFTTIFGLVPMAVGNAKMIGMPYAPLGRTMMGGLLASTMLTLVIVPLFYTLFDDVRVILRRISTAAVERAFGKRDEGKAAAKPAGGGGG